MIVEIDYRHKYIETEQGRMSVAWACHLLSLNYVNEIALALYDYATDHQDSYISKFVRNTPRCSQQHSGSGPVASPFNLPRASGYTIAKPKIFAHAVIKASQYYVVVDLLHQLMDGKIKPKDVLMPIRAAMDAGVLRRPSWEEFCSEFGKERIKSKASFSDYTNEANNPYSGANFDKMKEAFKDLIV